MTKKKNETKFKTMPKDLTDEEKMEFAREQIMIGNNNPFGLPQNMKDFADYYMYSGDVVISGIRAGYSETSGSHLRTNVLTRPEVKMYLQLLHDMNDSEIIADTEEVLTFLTNVMRGESFEPIKVGKGRGEERIQYVPPRISDRIKAGELLGRRYRAFDNAIDVTLSAPTFVGGDEIED